MCDNSMMITSERVMRMRIEKSFFPKVVLLLIILGFVLATVSNPDHETYALTVGTSICFFLAALFTAYYVFTQSNRKTDLMEYSLEALGKTYPRIARINYRTGECIFIKDCEEKMKTFVTYDWETFRADFLAQIHPEEVEKCRTFTALENFRRAGEQNVVSETCIYRRLFHGEYLWIQCFFLPVTDQGAADCVLMFAKNVDDSVKAEELYKKQLGLLLQKTRNAERKNREYLRSLSEDVRTPIDAAIHMTESASTALAEGNLEKTQVYLRSLSSIGRYLQTQLDDMVHIGVKNEQWMNSTRERFCLKCMLEGCWIYYTEAVFERREELFELVVEPQIERVYVGDEIRLIQLINAMITAICRHRREDGKVKLTVKLAESDAHKDIISFCVVGESDGFLPAFREMIELMFTAQPTEDSDGEEYLLPVGMALKVMDGEIRMDDTQTSNNVTLVVPLHRIERAE